MDDEPHTGRIHVVMTDARPGPDGRPLRSTLLGVPTDEAGRFEARVVPGIQSVSVDMSGGRIDSRESVIVGPGETVEQVFRLTRRKLEVRILTSVGQPVVGRRFWLDPARLSSPQPVTDDDGRIVLDPAPAEPFRIWTWPAGFNEMEMLERLGGDRQALLQYRILLGPIQVPDGEREAEVELRLPPGIR